MSRAKGSSTGKQPRCPLRAVIDPAGRVVAVVRVPRRRYAPLRRYVQRVKGSRFQARFFLGGPLNSVNLGLYPSPEAAARAAAEFVRLLPSAEDYPRVIAELAARGVVPKGLLPKWVYQREDGRFAARTRTGEHLAGPYETPAAACLAMLAVMRGKEMVRPRNARGRGAPPARSTGGG